MNTIPSFRNTFLGLDTTGVVSMQPSSFESFKNDCLNWLSGHLKTSNACFTKSCTQSLELAVAVLDLPPDSEIIIPSYGFVSLANAVAIYGHKCVFVDCDPDTLCLSFTDLQNVVSDSTKAVITINYGGVACDYEKLVPFCEDRGITLIEDNAHGLLASLNGRALGTYGHISTFSFDSLKMLTCYEGGSIASQNETFWQRIRTAQEMGTNRHEFLEGKVSFYEWKALGTNATLALPLYELLQFQFQNSEVIKTAYVNAWHYYARELEQDLESIGIRVSTLPEGLDHNGYIFWIMTRNKTERLQLQQFMVQRGIKMNPHYTALHKSEFGKRYHPSGRSLPNTEKAVDCMLRLPLYFDISRDEQHRVVDGLKSFYLGDGE